MAGTLIILEGPDGAGTTEHSNLLATRLRKEGRSVVLTTEPWGRIGRLIRSLLRDKAPPEPSAIQLLFCADRAEHIAKVISPALKDGNIVICDRYILSTLVYGAAANLDSNWLRTINDPFPTPDLTILTLPTLSVCSKRLEARKKHDHFENDVFQRRVYIEYTQHRKDPKTVVVDTSGKLFDVAEEVYRITQEHLGIDAVARASSP